MEPGTQMGVSENGGTPKSSILIGISIINHPFWGTPIFGNTQMSLVLIGKDPCFGRQNNGPMGSTRWSEFLPL